MKPPQKSWSKKRRSLTVDYIYAVYAGKLKKKKKNLSRCQCTPKNTGSMLCKLC